MSQRDITWWIEYAKRVQGEYRLLSFVCDPSEPSNIMMMRRAGLNAIRADNRVLLGLQAVQRRLSPGPGLEPRLFICRSAFRRTDPILADSKRPTSSLDEVDGYVWADTGKTNLGRSIREEPLKVDDHGMDMWRYAVASIDLQARTRSRHQSGSFSSL